MNRKELMRMLLMDFFVCYTCTMMATILFCGLNTPKVTELPVSYLWKAALFSLCADLPVTVYYSKRELIRRQWWIRTAFHTLLIEIVLLTFGYLLEMYKGVLGFVLFFFVVLIVDLIVRGVTFLNDKNTADEINARLKNERRRRRSDTGI